MPHYIAFLRGINLGRRRIKMTDLRARFEELALSGVTTFIASGNVIFSSRVADARKLTRQIQDHLQQSLGYEVDTFLRTRAEVAAAAAFPAFAPGDLAHPDYTVYVGLMHEPLSPLQSRGLLACRTAVDDFCVNGREYYWLCRIKSNDSKVWASPGLKSLKLAAGTMRNLTTMRKLAALYPAPSA